VGVLGADRAEPAIFYTGDSGYFDGYAAIGAEHGPFDATLKQIGAYARPGRDIHMTPERASPRTRRRRAVLIPLHWATFNPRPARLGRTGRPGVARVQGAGVRLVVPAPRRAVDVADPPGRRGWWQTIA
jgi:L-ascorbate metabolism protein UlaG (beta-lactamase superfamily)